MNFVTHPVRLVSFGIAAALVVAVPTAASAHDQTGPEPGSGHLVFVQTADPAGNTILEFARTPGGGLTQLGAFPTGGLGGTLGGAVADQYASEGSLTYDESTNLLYALNAGSDTITVFSVHGHQLVLRQVVGSGGDFPVSITADGGLVYVLNARGGGSIQGFVQSGGHLTAVPAWHRDLGFNPNPVPEFTSTPGEVAFTPGGHQLVVSTKGDGNSVLVFPLGHSGPGTPVVNTNVGAVPFGFVFDRAGNLVLTQAGAGTVSTYRILPGGTLRNLDTEVTGGSAVCWVTGANGAFYVSNTGSGSISSYTESGGGTLTKVGDLPSGAGPVDSSVSSDGAFLYVETGVGAGVDVYKIGAHGSLTHTATISVPGAAGGQGLVAL
jgi:6-phosphogluconolactonase (cycloisomerase 2 family)